MPHADIESLEYVKNIKSKQWADGALSCLIAELDTMIELLNCDCMEYMATVPDKYFDLAIGDPPYGIGMAKGIEVGKWKRNIHTAKDWDESTPTAKYWEQLFRVSKIKFVWGGNYFIEHLKIQGVLFLGQENGTNFMSDGELADFVLIAVSDGSRTTIFKTTTKVLIESTRHKTD